MINSVNEDHLVNYSIQCKNVRVIAKDGNNIGVITTKEALNIARLDMLDLVIINNALDPPIAKICDYTKFLYEEKKNKKEQNRKLRENEIHIKEIQLRPGITEHDLNIKLNHAKKWLEDNCKVKIVVKFRGREFSYKNKGFELVNDFISKLNCKVEKQPELGNNIVIGIVAPDKTNK
jgi:translation initiation factor IF-3